ncbi:MAG: FixH family protein [Xanthomonadales bacterium]|jgi:hypothetical protein|nr:FixH family protein [Xanthomonadales bacterium]
MSDSNPQERGISWRDPIVWVLLLPLVIAIGGGIFFIRIAITQGDQPLPQRMEKRGPIQYGDPVGIRAAAELGLSATLELTDLEVLVTLEAWPAERPRPELSLRFWHRTDGNRDQNVALIPAPDGRYRAVRPMGELPASLLLRIDPGQDQPVLELTGRLTEGQARLIPVEDA